MTDPLPSAIQVVGAAGVGMSAMAQLLAGLGYSVSGSDRSLDRGDAIPCLQALERAGVRLWPQDGTGVEAGAEAICVSTAIEDGNPDLEAARRRGIPVLHRAEVLAKLANRHACVAVTGSAGKSTTTGMAGWILAEAGWDPTVVNGAVIRGWEGPDQVGNVRVGRSDTWVIEADESDRSCLRFKPSVAVITNQSGDHFDLDEVRSIFTEFAHRATKAVLCGPAMDPLPDDDRGQRIEGDVVKVSGGWAVQREGRAFAVPVPGRHNAENALVAIGICRSLGLTLDAIARGLQTFRGVGRRLDVVGSANGIRVVDDYAHNPEKIAAAWSAVAEDGDRVIGIWRPHGFGPLAHLFNDLADSFASCMGEGDRLVVLPVYYAGGTAGGERTSDDLVAALAARATDARVLEPGAVPAWVTGEAAAGTTVLVMGARDPGLPALAANILREVSTWN